MENEPRTLKQLSRTKGKRRAHPDLNQGPADLQSAALTTELYNHAINLNRERYRMQSFILFVHHIYIGLLHLPS